MSILNVGILTFVRSIDRSIVSNTRLAKVFKNGKEDPKICEREREECEAMDEAEEESR